MKERNNTRLIAAIIFLAVIAFGVVVFHQSGIMKKTPVVTAAPDNRYEKTLTVITDEDYSPYSFYGEDGKASGHDVELIIMIANELGMNLDLRLMNWYEAIDAINAGEADVLMTCDYSDTFAGVDKLTKCEPVSFDDFIVYSRDKINSSDELYGKRVGIMRNGNVSAQIDMMNLDRHCVKFEDNRKAMQALIKGEVDCAIMRQTVGTVLLQELDSKGIEGYLGIGQSFMCFGVRDSELAGEINGAIETLKMNGTLDDLHNKWLTTFIKPYSFTEIMRNNIWLEILFIVLLVTAILAIMIDAMRKKKIEEERHIQSIEHQKELQEALDVSRYEMQRNNILISIINGSVFTFGISPDDELISAGYSDASKEGAGEEFTKGPMDWIQRLHPDDKDRIREKLMDCIRDHSGKKACDATFRIMNRDGEYRWIKSGGNVLRRSDGNGEFFGIAVDITEQMEAQQKRLLGAVQLSPDVLNKANIGLWAFELDEGNPPRMYGDEAMLRLVGLDHQVTPEEMYHAWYDQIDEGSYDVVTDAVEKMSSGEHAEVQYPWHHPDGHVMIVRCGGTRNPEYKKGIRIEGTHQDVTQTLHFDEENRKKERENFSLMLISNLSDAYTTLYYVEPESGNYQMISRDDEYGKKINTKLTNLGNFYEDTKKSTPLVIFGEDRGKMAPLTSREGMEAAFGDDNSFSISYRLLFGSDIVWYRVKAVKIHDSSGGLHYAVGVTNIEDEIRQKEQLEQALAMAQTASKAKTEFLFNMSHDIRTPMNAILGYTDIGIRHIEDKDTIKDSLSKIKTAGGHLLNLINDILEMSRIESGTLELVESPLDIREAIGGIEQMGSSLAYDKDIDFTVNIGEITNPYIYADELHVNEIIINLLSNAMKYTPQGGKVSYNVSQAGEVSGGKVRIRAEVIDNGIGMSEEFQEHLFETFSREKTSTVSKIEGTGIGLSIVKKIIDMAGGTITVNSKVGEGSSFAVELPFRVMDDEAVREFVRDKEESSAITEDIILDGKRVLLVEDNEMNREIATELLEEAGLTVEEAEDGKIAVDMVTGNGLKYYDYILMDIQMPVMNGYEATKAIRAIPNGDKIPIIALSANAFKEDIEKSLAVGMNGHIAKPIDVKELFETMHRLAK